MNSLLLVGCGKMGQAMLAGWLARRDRPKTVCVVEPNGLPDGLRLDGVEVYAGADRLPPALKPDVVILAVKPQMMDQAIPAYERFARPQTVFLSIAAGKTIAYFQNALGADTPIVRAMPNTPAAVGRGITVACPSKTVTEIQRTTCDDLLAAVGEVAWIDDESQIDAVTAVSGGGPAYVFLLMEVLARAGVAAGLPTDLAKRLARVTVEGAGELSRLSEDEPSTLRQNVTSPGGTTKAALDVLMAENGMAPLFEKAIGAAKARSRELA